jgi:hypothetical protein
MIKLSEIVEAARGRDWGDTGSDSVSSGVGARVLQFAAALIFLVTPYVVMTGLVGAIVWDRSKWWLDRLRWTP